ncbi:3'(2'),5'-bisphosphate nucleotidase CysQ [Amycolatopsis sp. OK19-0408]|uniref:3'(2'),5'-bisphosphate nucleotidase CysQ n=1 Tax=Amycolatopsis iheyensis TaxID=2945988 RepID=A0A9X2SP16_9PSEU|nr:inositol monophosphatase family protein [Amycolatopsis iheyensis]MCR6486970.1 3'(2'),5'-bisphosphate nucleotidase CysQ [Amycolatopsis iheyensis]
MTEVLKTMVQAAEQAGQALLASFDPASRPPDRAAMYEAGTRLEATSTAIVREALDAVPEVGWWDEDERGREVPPGRWWVVDGTEGAVNHVHGLPEWGVTITLVADGRPELAVVRQPIGDLTYTATRGQGAFRNGVPLRVSAKTELAAAAVTASQAGNSPAVYERFAGAWAAMAAEALLVRNTIPTTFPLLGLAAGQYDVFWQYEPDLPGSAAGSLLALEAGAVVSDLSGGPWDVNSADILVAAPGLHAAALAVLK